jgi:3-oxoacid CoA-transferase subunit B
MSWTNEQMADEVIKLFTKGCTVNLGIGLPSIVADRLEPDLGVIIHSENGVLGVGNRPTQEQVSPTLINAGKETITVNKGASFFDSSLSFGMIRGGHIDFSVLGGMEVDVMGNLANWMIPGKKVTGMGGAMDLVNGSKKVIVMMKHFTKKNLSKLKQRCTLPLTGTEVVHIVVTDMGVFAPTGNAFKIVKPAFENTDLDLGPIC